MPDVHPWPALVPHQCHSQYRASGPPPSRSPSAGDAPMAARGRRRRVRNAPAGQGGSKSSLRWRPSVGPAAPRRLPSPAAPIPTPDAATPPSHPVRVRTRCPLQAVKMPQNETDSSRPPRACQASGCDATDATLRRRGYAVPGSCRAARRSAPARLRRTIGNRESHGNDARSRNTPSSAA